MILKRNISGALAIAIIIIYTLVLAGIIGFSLLSWPKPMARTGQNAVNKK